VDVRGGVADVLGGDEGGVGQVVGDSGLGFSVLWPEAADGVVASDVGELDEVEGQVWLVEISAPAGDEVG